MRCGRFLGQFALAILMALAACKISAPASAKSEKTTGQEAARKPAPEMERLQKLYAGTWDYTETYAKTPSAPPYGAVGDFDGLLVMTWEPKESAYKSYVFGNDFPGCIVQTGHFEGDWLEFRSEFNAGGVTLKLRNVTRFLAPGKIVSEEYMAAADAPGKLFVSVDAKKRAQ